MASLAYQIDHKARVYVTVNCVPEFAIRYTLGTVRLCLVRLGRLSLRFPSLMDCIFHDVANPVTNATSRVFSKAGKRLGETSARRKSI